MNDAGERQRVHYERIHDDYEDHYYDPTSLDFRRRFIVAPMFDDLDLDGATVADLASGSGHNSLLLRERFPGALPLGFDISERACAAYREIVGRPAHRIDLTAGVPPAVQVDAAMIVGGLHHCVADLPGTFRTLAGLIRPGGWLLMCEPNIECFLEPLRRYWYARDRYFDAGTEHALDHDALAGMAAGHFEPVSCAYLGGPAYFLVLNSLVLRVPVRAKSWIAGPLFAAERWYNRLPGRRAFPYFVARWRRNDRP